MKNERLFLFCLLSYYFVQRAHVYDTVYEKGKYRHTDTEREYADKARCTKLRYVYQYKCIYSHV